MQNDVFHLRSFAEAAESFTTSKRNRASARENLGRVIQENLIYDAGGQRGPVYQRTAFDQETGDFQFAEASDDLSKIRAAVIGIGAQRHLFHADAWFFHRPPFLFFRKVP